MLRKKLTDEEMKIVEEIIDSTNEEYINQILDKYAKYNIPRYEKKKGLPIGYEKYFIMQSKDLMYRY